MVGDERADAKDVALFYEEFEDVCALANSCKGMSARENWWRSELAARARVSRRSRTCTAWQSGEVLEDPEAVYERIKSKHLVFSESREERGEHVALVKGRLTGHQFESVGL